MRTINIPMEDETYDKINNHKENDESWTQYLLRLIEPLEKEE